MTKKKTTGFDLGFKQETVRSVKLDAEHIQIAFSEYLDRLGGTRMPDAAMHVVMTVTEQGDPIEANIIQRHETKAGDGGLIPFGVKAGLNVTDEVLDNLRARPNEPVPENGSPVKATTGTIAADLVPKLEIKRKDDLIVWTTEIDDFLVDCRNAGYHPNKISEQVPDIKSEEIRIRMEQLEVLGQFGKESDAVKTDQENSGKS